MPLEEQASFNVPTASQTARFRTGTLAQPEGSVPAHVLEGVVIDLNFKTWTVDVISKFDQKSYLGLQIGTPYLHSNRGEGIYIMPDIGAKCHVCITSDGVPYLQDFIMPAETLPQEDAEDETGAGEGDREYASYGGGRVRAKPGDIYIKGRDGNFAILHKGGVLQLGASELAQRIYIPLQNIVTDISQNYRHYNTGGAITWMLASEESETNPKTIHRQTYRLRAGDEKASIRVTHGLLKDYLTEVGDANSKLTQLGIGTQALGSSEDDPIIFEVALSPGEIEADKGAITPGTSEESKLRFFFDKAGGAYLRSESAVYLRTGRGLRLDIGGDLEIHTGTNFNMSAANSGRIDGGDLLELQGGAVKINGGKSPAAHVGSQVVITLTKPLNGTTPAGGGGPVIIPPVDPLNPAAGQVTLVGTITTGRDTIRI